MSKYEVDSANEIKKAAGILGRKGGASKSEAKKRSSRENGKKGGRPIGGRWYVMVISQHPRTTLAEDIFALSPQDACKKAAEKFGRTAADYWAVKRP